MRTRNAVSTIRTTSSASRSRPRSTAGVRVIPVLVDGAILPKREDLPASIDKLTRRQGIEISHARFDSDVENLIRALSELEEEVRNRAPAGADRASHETIAKPPDGETIPAKSSGRDCERRPFADGGRGVDPWAACAHAIERLNTLAALRSRSQAQLSWRLSSLRCSTQNSTRDRSHIRGSRASIAGLRQFKVGNDDLQ